MRSAIVLLCLLACRCAPATPATPRASADLSATVVDADGPVAGAEVRLVTLEPAPCPCAPVAPPGGGGNEPLDCACPAALTRWRDQLARCAWPAPAATTVTTDARGHVVLRRTAGVTGIEVAHGGGVRWLPWPATDGPIALALAPTRSPRVVITDAAGAAGASIRGGFLFDDGHCVPLDRDGAAWRPRAPLPPFEQRGGTLVVEAAGHAPIVYGLFDEPEIELTLAPTETLEADDDRHRPCTAVAVVDPHGAPVVGAEVAFDQPGARGRGGAFVPTDARGIACLEQVRAGGVLIVQPPGAAGGQCAGETRLTVERAHLATRPMPVRLDVAPLDLVALRGRVLDAAGTPVDGVYLDVRGFEPAAAPGCSGGNVEGVQTGVDGRFAFPPLPRGPVTVGLEHPWYAAQELTLVHDGTAHALVLQRGDRWAGRVLDPDGQIIDRCELFLTLASGRLLTAACSATGFAFGMLTPGVATIAVRLDHHPLGTFRTLARKLTIVAGQTRRDDLAFPRGEDISGRVVDRNGSPVAGARLTALPVGIEGSMNRFHADEVMLEADADGRFSFRHLTPGTWRITGDRRAPAQTTLEVATNTHDVRFVTPAR